MISNKYSYYKIVQNFINIMRRQNNDEGYAELQQSNRYEDTLDVFINIVIKRSPTIFVLINMTLMIWLVQTIFSSNLESIPRSIYFFVPFLQNYPINSIALTDNDKCEQSQTQLNLNTIPTIKQEHIERKNLSYWAESNVKFCVKKIMEPYNFSRTCQSPLQYCSGYCVNTLSECPITDLKRIRSDKKIPEGYYQFFQNSAGDKYLLKRNNQKSFIVGLATLYENKCANNMKYFDTYNTFKEYWQATKNCGKEGSINPTIFRVFDLMNTQQYLEINGIMGPFIQAEVKQSVTSLGIIDLIKFKSNSQNCYEAQQLARNLSQYIFQNPVKPSFTQSLLVVCFIFFTGCWAWLIGFYCFDGKRRQKNMIVILMAIIQLIVVTFIYSQNQKLFKTEKVVQKIAECFENPEIREIAQWNFGISSSSPFLIIIYSCVSFLSIQLICTFLDRCIYEPFYQYQDSSHPHSQ